MGFLSCRFFFILRHGWIPLAISPKNKILVFKRFVSYFHQLYETLNDLVSTELLFFEESGLVRARHHLSREGGSKDFEFVYLPPPRLCSIWRLPLTCNQCSIISAYYMIAYDYVSLCYSWILNVTFVDKRAHIVHYATLLRYNTKCKNVYIRTENNQKVFLFCFSQLCV